MDPTGRLAQLVSIFATTMGAERAEQIVLDAIRELGLSADKLDDPAMGRVLEALGRREGIIGVTARFAATRRGRIRATGKFQVFPQEAPSGVRRSTPTGTEVYPEDIAAAFGASLDPEHALALVRRHWVLMKIAGTTCTRDQALAMLDAMAAEAGKAGVAATFAKARILMRAK